MAGGKWERQNKELSGAYTNVETNSLAVAGIDANGAEIIPVMLDWGPVGEFIRVRPSTPFRQTFGRDLKDLPQLMEAFKATGNVLLYNLNGEGTKATATTEELTATAAYGGTDGNQISVVVSAELDESTTIKTYYQGDRVDMQNVTDVAEWSPNGYVVLSGSLPAGDATLTLTGGETTKATNDSFAAFAAGLDTQIFRTVAYGTDDQSVKLLLSLKIKEMRDEEGIYVNFVTNEYAQADHEGTISIKNGVYVGERFIPADEAVYWYGAAYANAGSESLTYADYPGATDVERLSKEDIIKAKREGHVVFIYDAGADGKDRIVVESDINTFTSFTPKKNQDFRKGLIVRQMDDMGRNIQHIFSRYYIGKVRNHGNGRNLFKGSLMTDVMDVMLDKESIEPYDPNDIDIDEGSSKEAVLVNVGVEYVDAMEKLYTTVICK